MQSSNFTTLFYLNQNLHTNTGTITYVYMKNTLTLRMYLKIAMVWLPSLPNLKKIPPIRRPEAKWCKNCMIITLRFRLICKKVLDRRMNSWPQIETGKIIFSSCIEGPSFTISHKSSPIEGRTMSLFWTIMLFLPFCIEVLRVLMVSGLDCIISITET